MHTAKTETFFAHALGFPEEGYLRTQAALEKMVDLTADPVDGREVTSFVLPDGRKLQAGTFLCPTLEQLREETLALLKRAAEAGVKPTEKHLVVVSHHTGDVYAAHAEAKNDGAVFQAASQFNCLEMINPGVTPERGICCYANDRTQGPACARACTGGTAMRNYLIPVPGKKLPGQDRDHQINTLCDIEHLFKEATGETPWSFSNGYIESTDTKLAHINSKCLGSVDNVAAVKAKLRVGVQRDTQVTHEVKKADAKHPAHAELLHTVTQVYASAIPVGYSKCKSADWAKLAVLVLEATYEATLLVGIQNNLRRMLQRKKPAPVVLTLVGGGAYKNDLTWICGGINTAIGQVAKYPLPFTLDVQILSFTKLGEASSAIVSKADCTY